LIIAALLAVIVRPAILWLHFQAHLPRGLAVAVVYLGVAILVPLALLLAIPAIVDALSYVASLDYPSILNNITDGLRSSLASIKAAQLPVAALDAYVDRTADALLAELQQVTPTAVEPPPLATILRSLSSVLTTSFEFAAGLVGAVFSQVAILIFTFLASIYISLSAHTYRDAFLRLAPPVYRPEIATLLDRIERMWNAFFRGELTLMLLIGGITWVGLTALGMPGAFSLAIIAGLLELIPNLGPIIATIPAVIVALLQGSNYLPVSHLAFAGLVILFYILVQQLENNLIVPRVLGGAVELPPLIVMTGVLVGASVGGILGALLATPVVATGREILRYVLQKLKGEELFPPEAALEPAVRPSTRPSQRLQEWLLKRQALSRSTAPRPRDPEISPSNKGDPDAED
jgi:predicted PurR-regulated permease PerM